MAYYAMNGRELVPCCRGLVRFHAHIASNLSLIICLNAFFMRKYYIISICENFQSMRKYYALSIYEHFRSQESTIL